MVGAVVDIFVLVFGKGLPHIHKASSVGLYGSGKMCIRDRYTEVLSKSFALTALVADRDRILTVSGSGRRELADRSISQPLEKLMDGRRPYQSEGIAEKCILPCEGSPRAVLCAAPIIAAGDVTGVVAVSYTHLDVYKRQIQDYRKMNILQRSMASQGILNDTQTTLADYLMSIAQISVEDAGAIYIELSLSLIHI